MSLSREDLAAALRLLKTVVDDRTHLAHLAEPERRELLILAGRVSRPDPVEHSKLRKALRRVERKSKRAHDDRVLAQTGIRQKRNRGAFAQLPPHVEPAPADAPETFHDVLEARNCYVCKEDFTRVHFFYDQMCPPCATLNYEKRFQSVRLDGRVALVTGARVKIGYQCALMLLRAGAQVVATTRFPRDAARRFAREPDFAAWSARLQVHGLDLRHSPSVELFARHLEEKFPRLDILLNNAAQTVRRPAGFYAHLVDGETGGLETETAAVRALLASHEALSGELRTGPLLSAGEGALVSWQSGAPGAGLWGSAQLSQLRLVADDHDTSHFPEGVLDGDLQQIDMRLHNSWRMTADEVPTAELLETHLVNAIAPFLLCARLRRLMQASPAPARYIVNVSAMEAQFARRKKTDRHPHTNMAKAALNMLTRTSAADYADSRIYMNSVDTGWVTDEDPLHHAERKTREHRFHPPLDSVDGAARVLDPVWTGELTGKPAFGCFFKDYQPTGW